MTVYRFKRIVFESYPVLLACVVIGLSAGLLLDAHLEKLTPIILAMIPPINGLGGNVGSILGARLTSALHMGTIQPRIRGQSLLRMNVAASSVLSLVVFVFIGLIFFASAYAFGISTFWGSVKIAGSFFIASMVLVVIVIFTTIAAAFISFARGIDPDNVVIPIVTSVCDVLGVICLLIVIQVMGV